MKLRVGDSVAVKEGVVDPDHNTDISGWQGRIIELDYGETVFLRWDSVTLRGMGKDLIIRCENENLDFELMTLDIKDVGKVAIRDSEEDVSNTAAQLVSEIIGDPRLKDD